jgi:hypothetical protein
MIMLMLMMVVVVITDVTYCSVCLLETAPVTGKGIIKEAIVCWADVEHEL